MVDNIEQIHFTPIGYISSKQKYPYDAPRQGVFSSLPSSCICLKPHCNYEQALRELAGFDRIWVLFYFHHNKNWKPLVLPPRGTDKKIGLFATRSPYRPNAIGMSCVKLEKIDGLKIYITESDLLDETPVLDIKPYLPYCDSFPESVAGWTAEGQAELYQVDFTPLAKAQSDWLATNSSIPLQEFIVRELEYRPNDSSRKRVQPLTTVEENVLRYELAYRTWRVYFQLDHTKRLVTIEEIRSGYTAQELSDAHDPYHDKELHSRYIAQFMS